MMRQILTIFIFLFTHSLVGEDTLSIRTEQSAIEPVELSQKWWQEITGDQKLIEQKKEELIQTIQELIPTLSEQNQLRGNSLLEEIKINFNNYIQILSKEPSLPPVPTPIRDMYSIEGLVKLNDNYAAQTIKIRGNQEDLKNLQEQIKAEERKFDQAQQNYLDAEKRSQAKILFGMEVLAAKPALEYLKKKEFLTDRSLEYAQQNHAFLEEEIKKAKMRLVSSPSEVQVLEKYFTEEQQRFQEAQKARQQFEAAIAKQRVEGAVEAGSTKDLYLSLQLLPYKLEEVKTENRALRTQIRGTLARLILSPQSLDLKNISAEIKKWKERFPELLKVVADDSALARRIIERSSQLISLYKESPSTDVDAGEFKMLEESIGLGEKVEREMQGQENEIIESQFLLSVLNEKVSTIRGGFQEWVRFIYETIGDGYDFLRRELSRTLFTLGAHRFTLLAIVQFIGIMIGTFWLSALITKTLNRMIMQRRGVRKAVIYRLTVLFRYFLLFVGLIVALTSIGFDFSNFLIIAGALGVGLGFGLQNIFNNFISGIIILFQSHFKVGDFIELDEGIRGEIREINVRSTVITTNDGIDIIVPNSEMTSSRIVNWTLRDPYRRMHIPFSVAYGSDVDEVTKVVTESAKGVPSTLEKIGVRDPQVFLCSLGDNGLEMELVVWVNEKWARRDRKTRSEYLRMIEKTLKEHGFTVPFPQRDIHMID